MSIKCLIIDDEPLARQVLKDYIKNLPFMEIVSECKNAVEAISFLHQNNVDLIFLDIQMPGLSGLEFLKTLINPPKIIITSAFSEYALEGYEYSVMDYLLKPFSFERFLKAVNKYPIKSKLSEQPQPENKTEFIFIKADKQEYKINLTDILYFEAKGNYIKIEMKNKSIMILEKMKFMEERLTSGDFIRVHRSFIVSISKIESINGNMLKIGKEYIPIGKLYKKDTEKVLLNFRL